MISSLPQYLYHQTWQDGDLPWGARFCKVTWPNDHVDFQGHVINKSQYVSLTSILITTKLGRVVTYLEGFLPIKSRGLTRSHDRLKPLYLHYHNAYAFKIDRMVTYHESFLRVKSNDPLVLWSSCRITRQSKIISPLLQCFFLPANLAGWLLSRRTLYA